jgi:transposase-like protein
MRKSKKYDEHFKRLVVSEVLGGRITKEEARRRYDIAGKSTVLKWMRVMAGLKASAVGTDPVPILRSMGKDAGKTTPENDRKEQERLHAEIKRLKAALEHAELKGRAYEIMLEIGREQYGIDLEKKPGAKPSKDSKKSNRK